MAYRREREYDNNSREGFYKFDPARRRQLDWLEAEAERERERSRQKWPSLSGSRTVAHRGPISPQGTISFDQARLVSPPLERIK